MGCGGILGFAWTVAVLAAVEDELAWDVRAADMLVGTSAGGEIVAALGAGRSVADLQAALEATPGADPVLVRHVHTRPGVLPPLPRPGFPGLGLTVEAARGRVPYMTGLLGLLPLGGGGAGWLRELGTDLAGDTGWVASPGVRVMAADARTGRRVAFGSPGAPRTDLGSALAATWAIPGWFPPVRIDGRDYVDGGVVSPTSADLLVPLGLDELVIVAPMTSRGGAPARGLSRVERVVRRGMTRTLDAEEKALRAAGTRVIRIEPGPRELAVMGFNFMDINRRPATLAVAHETAHERVEAAIERSNAA